MTSKEKKQILLQYSDIDRHIDELQAELDMWWSRLSGGRLSDMPKGGESDGTETERAIERIVKIEQQIDDEIDELLIMRHKILSAINALKDIRERRVLYLAYVGKDNGDGRIRLKLWQVANEMHYSLDHVNRLHGMALKHINLEYAKS